MPYLDQTLPFSGTSALSRHTSELGASDARSRSGRQTKAYLLALSARGSHGLTDWEAKDVLGWERTTVNARRAPLCKGDDPWVETHETRPGPTGVKNAVWTLTASGREAVRVMREAKRLIDDE